MASVEFNGKSYGKIKGISNLSTEDNVLIVSSSNKYEGVVHSITNKSSIASMTIHDKIFLSIGDIVIPAYKKTDTATKLCIYVNGEVEEIVIMKETNTNPL